MSRFQVLVTDYAWPDLIIETEILARVDAKIVLPPDTSAATLAGLAPKLDAIMTNWAKVPASVIEATKQCQIVSRLESAWIISMSLLAHDWAFL